MDKVSRVRCKCGMFRGIIKGDIMLVIAKFSERDNRGKVVVDCIECKSGSKGDMSCSSGAKVKKGHVGSCFSGELLDGLIVAECSAKK